MGTGVKRSGPEADRSPPSSKGKVHPREATKAHRGVKYCSVLSLISALDGAGGHHHAPAALHLGKTYYPLYGRPGGPQFRSGRVRKISPFDPRTVQPVARRYTD